MVSGIENDNPDERIEECDSDGLATKKRLKPSYGSILNLKQMVTAIHVVLTHSNVTCVKP